MPLILSWIFYELMFLAYKIAFSNFSIKSWGSGLAKATKSSGSASLIPPTFVETMIRPEAAASKLAIQKDSVMDVLRKMCPLTRTFLTSLWGIEPNKEVLEYI